MYKKPFRVLHEMLSLDVLIKCPIPVALDRVHTYILRICRRALATYPVGVNREAIML